MIDPKTLEEAFTDFSKNLQKWVPEGIIDVDLKLLHQIGLLHHAEWENAITDAYLTQHFHVLETEEKVTLFNEQFAIWIIPELVEDQSITTVFIALLLPNGKPHLEIVYTAKGVYNTPKYILKVLQYFLEEVKDVEKTLSFYEKRQAQ